MNNDLISRDALKHRFAQITYVRYTADMGQGGFEMFSEKEIEEIIDKAPPVPLPDFKEGYKQAILDGKTNFPRPQGEWELHGMIYYCSECGHYCGESGDNFCGNCGADMRGGAE